MELIRFRKLDWLLHGFSTRVGGVSVYPSRGSSSPRLEKVLNLGFTNWDRESAVKENRRRFVSAVAGSEMPVVTGNQIHSDAVHLIHAVPSTTLNGDAMITSAQGLLLAVQTADCVPILLVDCRHRAVAAIHAGWRGTLARIAAKTLGRMQMEFSSRPEEVLAAIGPGIGQCCYEVGSDVVKEFAVKFAMAKIWFKGPFDKLSESEDPNPLPWLSMMPPGHQPEPQRCYLDLKGANSAILIEAGLRTQNIGISNLCTFCRPDLFFSYRRENRTGRMMSVIGIR